MAIIPNDEQFVGVSSGVDMTERKSSRLNNTTQVYTLQDFSDSLTPDLTPITVDGNSVSIASDPTAITQSTAVIQSSTLNSGIAIVPNGTGAITANIPDGTAAGGNARGTYSVDLQRTRNSPTRIASATNSVILSGDGNTASGLRSFVGTGYSNSVTANYGGIVTGYANNLSSQYGVISGGQSNTASTNTHATVVGGQSNVSSGPYSISGGFGSDSTGYASVAFGETNTASGNDSTVSGGWSNFATNAKATIAGGAFNEANGEESTVGGGSSNTADGVTSTIGGGWLNNASSNLSTVSGGQENTASTGSHATVVGGRGNTSSGQYSVSGGQNNTASGTSAVALGYGNTANEAYSVAIGENCTAGAGRSYVIGTNSSTGGSAARSGIFCSNGSSIGDQYDAIVGGSENSIPSGRYSFIGGGRDIQISATFSSAIGGVDNQVLSSCSSAIGGNGAKSYLYNHSVNASGYFSAIGDAQQSSLVARQEDTLTTGGTTVLSIDGTGTTNLIIPDGTNRAWNVTVEYIGVCTAAGSGTTAVGDVVTGTDKFRFKRVGGTSTIGSVTNIELTQDATMTSAECTYAVGGSNDLQITFAAPTTANTTTFRVVAKVSLVEVAW